MESDLAIQAQGSMKQAINILGYRESLKKSMRYRPTRRRHPERQHDPDSTCVTTQEVPEPEHQTTRRRHPERQHDPDSTYVTTQEVPEPEHQTTQASDEIKGKLSPSPILGVTFSEEEPASSQSIRKCALQARRPSCLTVSGNVLSVPGDERRGSLPLNCLPSGVAADKRRASTQLDFLPVLLSHDIKRSWEDRDKSKTITSEHEFLAWIVDEIQQSTAGVGRPRHKSRFFNIVLGGNVHLIRNVLKYLKKFRMKNELSWVLGTTPREYADKKPCSPSPCVKVFHVAAYIVWAILFLILTPIFYTVHIMAYMAHLSTRGRMSLAIQLPLVYAVLSEDPDMIQVFLDAGCPLDGEDLEGNNVYHYLADISLDDPEKAVRCHLILCSGADNLKKIKELITEKTNRLGITALEAIAKYGSTHFLRFIMVDKSCIGSLRLSVSKDTLWADLRDKVFDIKSSDITCLDSGSSTTERDDTECEASLNVWEFDISNYEMGDVHGKQSYLLQLVASRSVESMSEIDVWGFMQSKLLQKWISVKYKWYMPLAIFSHFMYFVITILVLMFIVNHGGDVDPAPLFSIFLRHDTDEIIEAGHVILSLNESDPDMSIWDYTCIGWDITWHDEIIDIAIVNDMYIDNCSASALAKIKDSCQSVSSKEIIDQTLNRTIKIESDIKHNSSVRTALDVIIVFHIILDVVIRQGFLWKNYNFKARVVPHGIWPVLIRRFPGSYTEKQLSCLMYAFYGGFIYTNYLWYQSIINRNTKYNEYYHYLFQRNRSAGHIEAHRVRAESLSEEMEIEDFMSGIAGNLVMVCLMLRFIHTIHALRLLPGVGFFVITTKKMAKHLLQFTLVFVIVSLAFATIFFFVMRKAQCPANKIEGFDTLWTSLFSTYQVALGYGEYNFTGSLNARIAYVAYTIISMLLLLNLIIAVMTTTAEELNQVPWKQALCCVERWDEILGTEVAMLTILAPFKLVYLKVRCLRENACFRKRPVWEDIKRHSKKTFEVTYLR